MIAKWWFSNAIICFLHLLIGILLQRKAFSSPHIFLFIYTSMDSDFYFIQLVTIYHYHSFILLPKLSQPWTMEPFQAGFHYLLMCLYHSLNISLFSSATKIFQDYLMFSLPICLNQSFLQRVLVPNSGEWNLQVLVLPRSGVLLVIRGSLHPGPLKCRASHTHSCLYLFLSLVKYIENSEFTLMPPIIFQPYSPTS